MLRTMTYSEYFFAKVLNQEKLKFLYEISVIFLGSIFLALASKINFILPFTPVPISLQTFAVLLLSMMVGRMSVYIVSLWIFEGVLGFPVFAKGHGLVYLLGPTGGYIFGFLVASYICGYLAKCGFDKSFVKTFLAMILGNLIIYFFGILWLLKFVNFDLSKAICIGISPFIIGDVLKIFTATIILPSGWKILK